ncbi:hypothetical protein [Sediminitomix flava]|nr:hypothetical protein [Sediminitomix flava]
MEESFNALDHSENKIISAAWTGFDKGNGSDQMGILFLRQFGLAFIGVNPKEQKLSSFEVPYTLISGIKLQKELLTDLTQAIIIKTPQDKPYIFKGMKGMIPSSFMNCMRKIELIE